MFFSIIVPVYNRERWIERCLNSVLNQCFFDFEVIVVDDGSTDRTLPRLRGLTDPRIHVVEHGVNRGVCPARNTGIKAASGEWLIFLDSDDELLPHALSVMHDFALSAPAYLDALWFRCKLDDGRISPDPMPSRMEWDYEGYIAFLQETHGGPRDMIRCVKRDCFKRILYPESRMLEDKFHLDFARHFRSRIHADVLRLYHQDADNQLVNQVAKLDHRRDLEFVRDRADGFRSLLAEHGPTIATGAPSLYREYLRQAALNAMMCGRPREALYYSVCLLRRHPTKIQDWMVLVASLAGPRFVGSLKKVRRRMNARVRA